MKRKEGDFIKPIIYPIHAFDIIKGNKISFTWSGNQAFKNKCIITNNSTQEIVYEEIQTTQELIHTINNNSSYNKFVNGALYTATIIVYDEKNIASDPSTPVLFYCYTTPEFKFTNIIDNQVLRNSSYEVELSYSQREDEKLQNYQIFLYNTNGTQLWSSGVKYDTSLSVTLHDLEITDLNDNGTYSIRATGYTINGMYLDTGHIHFSVNYIMPSAYAVITLENKKDDGLIKIQSNIVSIEGKYISDTNTNPTYINDDYIDLTASDNEVVFDKNFILDRNYVINIKGYNFDDFSTILQLSDGEKNILLKKKKGTYLSEGNVEKVYFELNVPSAINNYVIRSNFISMPDLVDIQDEPIRTKERYKIEKTYMYSIWIKKIDNVYDLYVKNLSV